MACANEVGNCTVLQVSSAELNTKYVGESETNIRNVFAMAKHLQPTLIFIDKADAVFGNRRKSHTDHSKISTCQFLSKMQTRTNGSVFVIAEANYPGDIDSAILRRLEIKFTINLPEWPERALSMKYHLQGYLAFVTGNESCELGREIEHFAKESLVKSSLKCSGQKIYHHKLGNLTFQIFTSAFVRNNNTQDFLVTY